MLVEIDSSLAYLQYVDLWGISVRKFFSLPPLSEVMNPRWIQVLAPTYRFLVVQRIYSNGFSDWGKAEKDPNVIQIQNIVSEMNSLISPELTRLQNEVKVLKEEKDAQQKALSKEISVLKETLGNAIKESENRISELVRLSTATPVDTSAPAPPPPPPVLSKNKEEI